MGKALNDLRVQTTDFVDRILTAEARGTGDDKQVVARRVLEQWAKDRHKVYTLYARSLKADGLQMELDGLDAEDDGGRAR